MNRSSLISLIVALSLFLVVVAGGVVGYLFIENQAQTLGEVRADIAHKEQERAESARARAELAELMSEEVFVRSNFVQEADLVPFLERLEEAGEPFGAAVSVVSVSGEQEDTGFITIALSIEGSFDGVLRTLGVIEHGPSALKTNNVALSALGDGSWSAAATLQVATISEQTP